MRFAAIADVMVIYATVPFVTAGLAYVFIGERPRRATLVASTTAVAGVLVIGAYTVSTNGGFGCTSWPDCREAQIPFLSGERLQHIQCLHRFTVAAGAGAVAWLFLHVRTMLHAGRTLQRLLENSHAILEGLGKARHLGSVVQLATVSETLRPRKD